MTRMLSICFFIWAIVDSGQSVSTKMDFGEEKESSSSVSNSSKEEEDVEVQHTIVVSTKLKNNNRRGFHSHDGNNGALTYTLGHAPKAKDDDSGEVPVVKGYKSVESTIIRTPDTRNKPPIFTDSVFIKRNMRTDYDPFPVASNPSQWKPSSYFNNINWRNDDHVAGFNDFGRRRDWLTSQNNYQRKLADDSVREFYCRKCTELTIGPTQGCVEQRRRGYFESTTPKIKIDGKIVKFN